MSVNKVILIGRLGQDPELKHTPSGATVCTFSIATTESWVDKQTHQKQEKTEWHRIVVWGKMAEICNQYLGKGKQAFVEGRIQTRSWEDESGMKKYATEILASSVQFLGGSSSQEAHSQGGGGKQSSTASGYQVATDANFAADDLPF